MLTIAALAALLRSAIFVVRHFSGDAYGDFWLWVGDFQRWTQGNYTFHDLIKPHFDQHRIATTRLLLLLDSTQFDMTGRSVAAINFVLLAAVGLLLWRLTGRDGVARTGWDTPAVFWAALMCATCQVDNLIFPFQVQFALTCLAAVAATSLLTAACDQTARAGILRNRPEWLAAAAGSCAVLAAFSMASGILLAPALFGMLVLRRAGARVWAVFTPICLFGVAAFFHHLPHAATVPLLDRHLIIPRIVYVGNYVASGLSAFPRIATGVGLCELGSFAVAVALLLRRAWRDRAPVPPGDAALAALGVFVILCGPAATLTARLLMGPQAALVSRYATMSLLLVLVLFGLAARWGARRSGPRWASRIVLPAAGVFLLAILNVPQYDRMAANWRSVRRADADLLANDVGIAGPAPVLFTGTVDDLRPWIAFLHAARLNIFAPEDGPPAGPMALLRRADTARLPPCRGSIDQAYAIDSTGFLIHGWVADPEGRTSPRWFAALDAQGRVLGAAEQVNDRPDVTGALGLRDMAHGFESGFRLATGSVLYDTISIRIAGMFPGRRAPLCILPKAATIGPVLLSPVAKLQDAAPAPLLAPPEIIRFAPSTAGAAPAGVPAWHLTLTGPEGTASLQFRIANDAHGRALAIPFAMTDESGDRHIDIIFSDGARLAATLPSIWQRPEWRAAIVAPELLARHQGAITVEVHAGGDTGLSVGAPLWTTIAPEWSRLF